MACKLEVAGGDGWAWHGMRESARGGPGRGQGRTEGRGRREGDGASGGGDVVGGSVVGWWWR